MGWDLPAGIYTACAPALHTWLHRVGLALTLAIGQLLEALSFGLVSYLLWSELIQEFLVSVVGTKHFNLLVDLTLESSTLVI